QSYVEKFEPVRYMTKVGTPALDGRGRPRVEARYINTKSLLECQGRAECKLLLDNMADFGDELLKIVADQKGPKKGKKVKSRASTVLNQSGPAGSSSPGGVSSSQAGVPS
ncbi:hypothetical protein A2U01_0054781, partial [Trifolium medium]|nr:hypothetical protein [Trifolium medium]